MKNDEIKLKEFPPPCGAFCPGCQLCCDIVFCGQSSTEKTPRHSTAERLIDALEELKKRTEFLQKKCSFVEKVSVGTQVDKFSFPYKSKPSVIDPPDRSENSEDKNFPSVDSKEIINLCLTMMKEIKEVRDSLNCPSIKICKICHSRCLDSQQTFESAINCPKCKRMIHCYQSPQYSRGTSCYFKNRKNCHHPSANKPRAFPRRRKPPEEIQNTWCCWPFF